jgi:hypothetical protein
MSRYSPRARLTNTASTSAVANWFGNQFVNFTPGAFESIATSSVGSGGTTSITFSSIPGTYSHLQIRGISKIDQNYAYPIIRPNNDSSTANYTLHQMYGNGSAISTYSTGTGSLAGAYAYYGATSTSNANVFGPGVITIMDYANTNKYKTLIGLTGFDDNGSTTGYSFVSSSLWLSTSAITSITIVPQGGKLSQYSHFALYGIKAAA